MGKRVEGTTQDPEDLGADVSNRLSRSVLACGLGIICRGCYSKASLLGNGESGPQRSLWAARGDTAVLCTLEEVMLACRSRGS